MEKDLEENIQERIQERIAMAEKKRIFQKASAVAQKFGKYKTTSYCDSGETFYEDNWTFEKDGLEIWCHEGHFGHVLVTIEYNSKPVFNGTSTPKSKSNEIDAYVPNSEWEKRLYKFYQPIHKEIQKEEKQKQDSLRKRFGL